jgi:hypothetical protein
MILIWISVFLSDRILTMEPLIITIIFYLAVMFLCLARPNAGRIFIGLFFLVMAFGVHGYFIVANPQGYLDFANDFSLSIFRDLAVTIVEVSPIGFGVLMLVFETAVGLLILSKGRYVDVGLIAGIVFLVGIAPWGMITLPNLILALAMTYLVAQEFHVSGMTVISARVGHLLHEKSPA